MGRNRLRRKETGSLALVAAYLPRKVLDLGFKGTKFAAQNVSPSTRRARAETRKGPAVILKVFPQSSSKAKEPSHAQKGRLFHQVTP